MALDLSDFELQSREAVMAFWGNREAARKKQLEAGIVDQGERAGVTGGKNMDGFLALIIDLVRKNGLINASVYRQAAKLVLPGYFRPTKRWDVLVLQDRQLIAAIELKSHIGPSFGNNFNNRAEEAIGTAQDLWTAYRESAFGERQPRPFVGWLMLVEDEPRSRAKVKIDSPHFPLVTGFEKASYLHRYDLLAQRLVTERLYSAAAVIAAARSARSTGEYSEMSELTGLKTFVATFAGHVAAMASQIS